MFTRVIVLNWAEILFGYAIWMLMIYLTDVWKLTIAHAAAIITIQRGLIYIFPLVMQIIVDTLSGHYWMLMFSSVSCCTGMGLLTMSTPPVLSKSTGTCDAYEPECIGDTQQILFYIALVLLAVGMAGHAASLGAFLADQIKYRTGETISDISFFASLVGHIVTFFIGVAAVLGLPYVRPWSLKFGIPAIFMLVATLLFWSGSSTYTRIKPQGSHLTMVLRVFVASTSKLFHQRPADSKELYQMHLGTTPHIRGFRGLDKAAIVLPNQPLEEQERNRWKLCTVLEVENTKLIISLVPMAMSFLLLGLFIPLAYTYFVEQAKTMNHKVGSLTIPIAILLWFKLEAREYFPRLYARFAYVLVGAKPCIFTSGIAVSMMLAVLCCVTAAKVESRRLNIVNSHNLLDKPNEKIPMSIFWLLPQFILHGAIDGTYVYCLADFFNLRVTPTLTNYMVNFVNFVNGLGCLASILLVYVVSNISEKEGKSSWFKATLNKSRLDNYYWLLSALMAINLVWFLVMRLCYYWCSKKTQDQDGSEESDFCFCC